MGEIHTFLGAPVLLHEILSRTACSECWSHFKRLRGEATFSQIVRKINLNCPHVSHSKSFSYSYQFFPHSPKNPQTLDRAQGRWRDAPRSAAARAETLQAIGAGTGGTTFRCRRYRRPSWVGGWGRNHGQNGPMEGVIKQRTKMGISCRLYPILPNVKFPPLTPWF